MESINFSKNILKLRKERGITQKDLADYLGITKAAVSKWEIRQSYPDITLLPVIASYFGISVDKLLGYQPMMEEDEIKKLYNTFSEKFSKNDFKKVYEECIEYEKKYYKCYLLQFYLGLLYINHVEFAESPEFKSEILNHCVEIFERIQNECGDIKIVNKAQVLKNYCYLCIDKANEVIEDLEGCYKKWSSSEILLSRAYQIKGQKENAIKVLQIYIFNNICQALEAIGDLINCYSENREKVDLYLEKIVGLIDLFDLENESPSGVLTIYIRIAINYSLIQDKEKCLLYLEKVVDLLHEKEMFDFTKWKNEIFDCIPKYREEIDNVFPRKEKTILKSLKELIANYPGFEFIKSDIRYNNLLKKL